jgi:hypothetical protein
MNRHKKLKKLPLSLPPILDYFASHQHEHLGNGNKTI